MKHKLIHILKKTGIVLVGLVILVAAVIGFVFQFHHLLPEFSADIVSDLGLGVKMSRDSLRIQLKYMTFVT